MYLQCSKFASIHEESYYTQGRTSPFLPHLPLSVYLWKKKHMFFSGCYWSSHPPHFTVFIAHTLAFLSVVSFVTNGLFKYLNLFTGYWPRAISSWKQEVFNFIRFFVFILFFTDLLLLLVYWRTLDSKVRSNEMAAVDKPRTYSALLSRSVVSWQAPFVLSGHRLGLLLRNCHCNLCQKRVHWRGLHSINSSFLSWHVVPWVPSGAVFRPVFLCISEVKPYAHREKQKHDKGWFWVLDCSLGIVGCEFRFWLSCLFCSICQLLKLGNSSCPRESGQEMPR